MCEGLHQQLQPHEAAAVSVDRSKTNVQNAEPGRESDVQQPHAAPSRPCKAAATTDHEQDLSSNRGPSQPALLLTESPSELQQAENADQHQQQQQCNDVLISRWANYDPLLEFSAIAEQSRRRQQARSAEAKDPKRAEVAVSHKIDGKAAAVNAYTSVSDRKHAYMAAATSTGSSSNCMGGSSAAVMPTCEISVADRRNCFTATAVTAGLGTATHKHLRLAPGHKAPQPVVGKGKQTASSAGASDLGIASSQNYSDYRTREVAEMAAALLRQHSLLATAATAEASVGLLAPDHLTTE